MFLRNTVPLILLILCIAGAGIWYATTLQQQAEVPTPEGTASATTTTLGFIRYVDTSKDIRISFDEAEWLSGKAGEDAAIRAGVCTEETRDECLPNDYFIDNPSTSTPLLYEANPRAKVIMQTLDMETKGVTPHEIDLATFAKLINDKSLHWNTLPYHLTVQGNIVTKIEEIYVP